MPFFNSAFLVCTIKNDKILDTFIISLKTEIFMNSTYLKL